MNYRDSGGASHDPNARPGSVETPGSTWRIGVWQLDSGAGELRRDGESLRLEPKVIEVLVYLAQRVGQVVSRDELLTAVWPGVVVGDDALTQAVIKLRKALGDDARKPSYIETLAKRGYRLIAAVERVSADGGRDTAARHPGPTPSEAAPLPTSPIARSEAAAPPPADALTEAATAGASAPTRPRPRRLIWIGGGLAAFLVAATLLAGMYRSGDWPIGSGGTPRTTTESLPVIAVLPLANQSGNPAREFFSDGVTDEIIHALGRYSGLRVISRNSVQQFKQREALPKVVSSELGARYVVTGSVREADGQVRVAVELSDAQTARVLWSERFDGKGGEVFRIQDSIVQNIVGTLAVKVSKIESDRAASRPPGQREAYDLVLLARALELKAERAANRQGRMLIGRARDLAPDYAMVYVVESELEFQRADLGWMEDPRQGILLAERAARRALTLDDPGANARAYAKLARIHALRREFDQALSESERALALNPSDIFIAEVRAETLLWTGRSLEAANLLESALRLDPAGRRSPVRNVLVVAYVAAERYPQALAACDRALADNPDLPMLHTMRAAILAQTDRLDEARRSVEEVKRLQPNFPYADFGERFADAAVRDRIRAALRKAGF